MNFIISSQALLKGLQSISGVIATNNTLPILDNFLFTLEEGNLTVTASDLETTMSCSIKTDKSDQDGQIAVPARILMDMLKTFSEVPINISTDLKTFNIELSANEGKFKLAGKNPEEFPRSPQAEGTSITELSSKLISQAINKTMFATGTDTMRMIMTGVFCELYDDYVSFVATDAHKLVRYRRYDAGSEEKSSFTIPKKPLNQLKALLANEDFPVKVEFNETNVFFSFNNISLVSRLIEGKYPNYEAVIPTNNPNKMIVDRLSFLNSIKRVSIFANQSTHQIRLKISGKELILSAEDLDYSNEAKERLTCSNEGEDIEIGFNSRFLVEMISNIDTPEVLLEMSAPNRAGLIKPVDPDNKQEDVLMLLMPVMLNA